MTTITREEQKQVLINTANHVINRDNTSPYSENLRELARIALASLEAEPIGAFHIAEQQVDGTSDYIKDGEWPIDNGIIEVYATPPAPVVPEEKPMPNPLSMLEREITQLIGDAQEATVTGYELIAEAWRLMDDCEGNKNCDVVKEMARIALASLEAEPVAWLLSGGGAKNNVSFDSGNAYADPLREVTPLYTAPPAPVSVPAAMEIDDDFDSAFEHGKAVGWNAYRAAMLQAEPVSNSDELTDGWVACSKRMPSPSTGVIVAAPWQSAPGGYAMKWATNCPGHPDADIDGWIIPGASWSPTHWMPLPAAPQQEDIIC